MDINLQPWTELKDALDERGLMLVDISRDSKIQELRTKYSIQYLSDLQRGRRDNGLTGIPNIRVIHAIARVLEIHPAMLTPKRPVEEPQALAS